MITNEIMRWKYFLIFSIFNSTVKRCHYELVKKLNLLEYTTPKGLT